MPPLSFLSRQVGLRACRGMGWLGSNDAWETVHAPASAGCRARPRLTDSLPRHGGGRFPAARPVRVWFCSPRARRPAAGALLAVSARPPALGEPCQCSHAARYAMSVVLRRPSGLPPRSGRTRATHMRTFPCSTTRAPSVSGKWERKPACAAGSGTMAEERVHSLLLPIGPVRERHGLEAVPSSYAVARR